RVHRKRESWPFEWLRCHQRNAAAPAANMNTGAQKCVTHRVKKSAGVVRARSVGENDMAPRLIKSRMWSSAIRIMTAPRSASSERSRDEGTSIGVSHYREIGLHYGSRWGHV